MLCLYSILNLQNLLYRTHHQMCAAFDYFKKTAIYHPVK